MSESPPRALTITLAERVLEHAPVGLAVLRGDDLRVAYANPAILALAGLAGDVAGQRFERVFPASWTRHAALLRGVIRSGGPVSLKAVANAAGADGPNSLDIDCILFDDRDGPGGGAVMISVQDVTEQAALRHVAEARALEAEAGREALAEREEQLRLSVSSAPLVLYARDRNLNMSWIYKPRSRADLSGNLAKPLEEVVDPADVEELRTLYLDVLNSGEPRQHLMKFHHSSLLDAPWQDVHVQPQRDRAGRIIGVLCAAYDVTDLVEARAALAEREAQLELALEVAQIGTWEYDAASGLVRYSASLAKIYDLPADSARTDPLDLRGLIHPDDYQRVIDQLNAALAGRGYVSIEYRIVGADGEERWVTVRARSMGGERDRGDHLVGVALDSTGQRRLREGLEQSNRVLERFAYTVAHDLKSPLQAMVGFGQLLTRSATARLTAVEAEHLEFIVSSGRKMAALIDDILAFAQAVHTAPVRQPVSLEDALAQALERLRLESEEDAAEITHGPLPTVRGNPTLLLQILQNLIGNAFKYRDRAQELRVHVSAERRGPKWVIAVRDNGIGIRPERQEGLFEAFRRAHVEAGYAGIGLGLTLVRDAVAHHGGEVWLESAPGRGSTFYFSLPVAPDA